MSRASATAKLNLALIVGPRRADGKHELTTVYQRVAIADRVEVGRAPRLRVEGFAADTLVRDALVQLARAAGVEPCWRARIWKRVPVAAGLGGGSSDAATALVLANRTLAAPLPPSRLHELAQALGADVAFFLERGPQLGSGDGSELAPLDLPQDYFVVVAVARDVAKTSTADVYLRFDTRRGADGYDARRAALLAALAEVRRPRDLATLPPNDLAASPLADELRALGAFRADVTGAGPAVYGLFQHRATADAARRALRSSARLWVTVPAWYG